MFYTLFTFKCIVYLTNPTASSNMNGRINVTGCLFKYHLHIGVENAWYSVHRVSNTIKQLSAMVVKVTDDDVDDRYSFVDTTIDSYGDVGDFIICEIFVPDDMVTSTTSGATSRIEIKGIYLDSN